MWWFMGTKIRLPVKLYVLKYFILAYKRKKISLLKLKRIVAQNCNHLKYLSKLAFTMRPLDRIDLRKSVFDLLNIA